MRKGRRRWDAEKARLAGWMAASRRAGDGRFRWSGGDARRPEERMPLAVGSQSCGARRRSRGSQGVTASGAAGEHGAEGCTGSGRPNG